MYLRDLADFFTFFFFFIIFYYADSVSVCVVQYVIILIQILIRYNVKNLITACTRSLDFDLKIEKSPYPGRGGGGGGHPPPRPSPRSVASLPRICHFSTRCPPPPMRWPTVRHWGPWSYEYGSSWIGIYILIPWIFMLDRTRDARRGTYFHWEGGGGKKKKGRCNVKKGTNGVHADSYH